MIRKIWILWLQGFDEAPYLVRKCLESWKVQNAETWEIIELSSENLSSYIDLDHSFPELRTKEITNASLSDIIRIELLQKHGGVWADATTFCNRPLDTWLEEYVQNGFFAFGLKADRILSSWFLYADKPSYIVEQWRNAVARYVGQTQSIGSGTVHISIEAWKFGVPRDHYFWLHYLFGDLYRTDDTFRSIWMKSDKIDAQKLHYIQAGGMARPVTEQVRHYMAHDDSPVYKLTYRYDQPAPGDSVLEFLFSRL